MRIFAYLACLLLSALSSSVWAETRVNLFEVETAIPEPKAGAQISGEELARREGMRQVIVRATGNTDSLQNAVVKKALSRNSRYLSTISSAEVDGQPVMKMAFNPAQIRELLAQANLAYWPEERANILVWVVEDNGYDRTIAWEQSGRRSVADLTLAAQQRGLPITVPVGDIDDITSIESTELWGGFMVPTSETSQRYPADAVAVLRVERNGQQRRLRWALYDDEPKFIADPSLKPLTGSVSGSSQQVMQAVVASFSEYYAAKYASKSHGEVSSSVRVNFTGISEPKQFFDLERMLQDLSSVASVELDSVTSDEVRFRVNLITDQQDFEKELMRNRKIGKRQAPPEPLPEPIPVQEASSVDGEPVGELPSAQAPSSAEGAEGLDTPELVEPEPEMAELNLELLP